MTPKPTSIRFEEPVVERLASYVARHPGLTRSAVAARYVDEGLRMEEHPGILFREGPVGRRATVAGGPDVWEVVRDVRATRAAEPALSDADLLTVIEENTGVPRRLLQTALGYWGAYPEEVDALVAYAERVEAEHAAAADRSSGLLGS
ncbi:MAG: hypothetical protein ACTHOD_03435 [Motilibacteraceae bacterium]